MHFTILANPSAAHQVQHQKALAEGFRAHGVKVTLGVKSQPKTKFVACWGWRIGKALRKAGHEVLVMERGYLGDRFAWSSIAWNGLNGRGDFPVVADDCGKRFNENFSIRPWRDDGQYILVMGQVPGDASLQGKDLMPWYQKICDEAAIVYGLPVMFRAHPEALKKGYRQVVRGAIKSTGSLDDALSKASMAVTFNSNSGVDAVLAGVPTVAVDIGSMAWDVVGHSLTEKIYPDRSKWAAELAWKQWRLDEIESGAALLGILGGDSWLTK